MPHIVVITLARRKKENTKIVTIMKKDIGHILDLTLNESTNDTYCIKWMLQKKENNRKTQVEDESKLPHIRVYPLDSKCFSKSSMRLTKRTPPSITVMAT